MNALAFAARATIGAVRLEAPRDAVILLGRMLVRSIPIVVVVAFFAGAMLTVQAAASLTAVGAASMSGMIVGFGGVREVFPLLAAGAVAARTGAELASELGTMRVTQQTDALEVMGLDPMRLLVGPRLLAAVIGTPLCVVAGDVAGILGAQTIGSLQLGIDRGAMWTAIFSAVVLQDFVIGAAKGLALGFLLGVVSTREGLSASGGALGVGRATNRAVVRSMIAVCLADVVLSFAIYGRGALP